MKNRLNSKFQKIDGTEANEATAFQNGRRYGFGVFFLLLLCLVCYISVLRINGYSAYIIEMNEPDLKRVEVESFISTEPEVWNELVRYARNINRYYIYHRDFYSVPNDEKVTAEDMAEDMAVINQSLNGALEEASQKYNDIMLDSSKTFGEQNAARTDFDNEVSRLLDNYTFDIESAKDKQLTERISNFFAVENYLDTTREFTYYISDAVLDRTFTNIVSADVNAFMANETYMNVNLIDIRETFNGVPLSDSFETNGISGFIMVPKAQPVGSVIKPGLERAVNNQYLYERNAETLMYRYFILLGAAIALIIMFMWRGFLPNLDKHMAGYMAAFKVYLKIPLFLKFFLAFYGVAGIELFINWRGGMLSFYFMDILSVCLNVLNMYIVALLAVFSLTYIFLTLRGKVKFKDEYEYRFFMKSLYNFTVMRKASRYLIPVVSLIILVFLMFSTFSMLYTLVIYGVQSFTVIICAVYMGLCLLLTFLLGVLSNYSKLSYYIKNIYEGNNIDIPEENGGLAAPVNMLNGLSEGMKKTLDEMLIAERTKSELITNVSHDLKTPLTSIINYVELLKRANLPDETTKEYVDILKQKSQRLKLLIDDLFEATKLSSHSMELNYDSADIVELLKQSIGEMSEKFEEADLDIKFSSNTDHCVMMLDGQRMWRVFENLLNNILKYAPKNTRVYITLDKFAENIEITMKNISAFELNFKGNELFERFTRGDSSRSTEGSGLGLSITKDIIELHGGKMDIVIDGDLFKVIILLKNDRE